MELLEKFDIHGFNGFSVFEIFNGISKFEWVREAVKCVQ